MMCVDAVDSIIAQENDSGPKRAIVSCNFVNYLKLQKYFSKNKRLKFRKPVLPLPSNKSLRMLFLRLVNHNRFFGQPNKDIIYELIGVGVISGLKFLAQTHRHKYFRASAVPESVKNFVEIDKSVALQSGTRDSYPAADGALLG